MKRLIIAAAFILLAGVAYGQTMQKGVIIGVHTTTVTLNPDVTMDQYQDFILKKLIPEWEKHFPGAKLFISKGLNRENKDEYAMFVYIESKKVYYKYWNDDGSATDDGAAAAAKVQPTVDELTKLGTYISVVNDWVIQ